MHRIKYFVLAVVNTIENEDGTITTEKDLVETYYDCKDIELEKWYNHIVKCYGKYGEVSFEQIEDELTKEELEKENLKAEIKALKEQLLEVQNYVVDKEYNNLLENGGMKNVV